MNFKFIISRVAGDENTFDKVFKEQLPNMQSEVLSVFDEAGKKYTIMQKYNRCIEEMIFKGVSEDDVWCFMHNDTGILDSEFVNKVEMVFKETDTTMIGVVGSCELRDDGCWWGVSQASQRGHIIQGSKSKMVMDGFELIKGSVGFYDDVIALDGLCLIVKAKSLVDSGIRFRTDIFSGNHFYDLSLCLDLLLAGYSLAVVDLLVYHQSEGAGNNQEVWTAERNKFVKHYKSLGLVFPLDKKSIENYRKKNLHILDTTVQEFKL